MAAENRATGDTELVFAALATPLVALLKPILFAVIAARAFHAFRPASIAKHFKGFIIRQTRYFQQRKATGFR